VITVSMSIIRGKRKMGPACVLYEMHAVLARDDPAKVEKFIHNYSTFLDKLVTESQALPVPTHQPISHLVKLLRA
jgi:hypothetical protein